MSVTTTVTMDFTSDALAVRTDCDDGDCVENQPVPAAMTREKNEVKSPAQWAYERLVLYIQKFEEMLDNDHEIGMGFAGSEAGSLHIQGMGYFAPDIITFYGIGPDGGKMQLVQHVNQLSVMLKAAAKITEEPTRIGFRLKEKLEESESGTAN